MGTTKEESIEDYTELLSDEEVNFLLKIARECSLISKDDGLQELHTAFNNSKDDDQKAEILRALGNVSLGVGEPGAAGAYLTKAKGLAKSSAVLSRVSSDLASYYTSLQKYKDASYYVEDAIKTAETVPLKGASLTAGGILSIGKADYDQAITHFAKAAGLFRSTENYKQLSETQILEGDVYFLKGMFNDAKKTYREALRFAQKTKGKVNLTPIFFRLGETLMELNKLTPAITYFEDCLKDKSDPITSVRSLRNLAECYRRIGGDEDAEKSFKAAVKESTALNDDAEITQSRDAFAAFLIDKGRSGDALEQLKQSFNVRREYYSHTGAELKGAWKFAEAVYNLLSESAAAKPEPAEAAPAAAGAEASIRLSGEVAAEARELLDTMQYVVERPKVLADRFENLTLKEAMKLFKKEFLTKRLEMVRWDKNKLAKQMGVTLSNLYHHLESLGMNK